MKQMSEAVARNRELIREVLAQHLPQEGLVLEIASGTGEHAVHMARHFRMIQWQPTDAEPAALASIAAWRADANLSNLLEPIDLDVTNWPWPIAKADAIVCINMIHISPWEASEALFAGAARALPANGLLYLYGPYKFHGRFTAPSNEEFDRSLRARNATWGVREIRELTALGQRFGIALEHTIAMPANNHSLIFRRHVMPPPSGAFKAYED